VRQTLRALALRRIAGRSTPRRIVDRKAFFGLAVTARRRLLRPCLAWQPASTPPTPPGRLVRLTLAGRRGRQIFDHRGLVSRRGLLGMSFTACLRTQPGRRPTAATPASGPARFAIRPRWARRAGGLRGVLAGGARPACARRVALYPFRGRNAWRIIGRMHRGVSSIGDMISCDGSMSGPGVEMSVAP
jgi:hypothetical protein